MRDFYILQKDENGTKSVIDIPFKSEELAVEYAKTKLAYVDRSFTIVEEKRLILCAAGPMQIEERLLSK